tara:strand:- start:2940 stop:3935 length:996 start_codon:yes stop_codon:yes gene_type:complete
MAIVVNTGLTVGAEEVLDLRCVGNNHRDRPESFVAVGLLRYEIDNDIWTYVESKTISGNTRTNNWKTLERGTTYSPGNGIEINDDNVISLNIGKGLTVDNTGNSQSNGQLKINTGSKGGLSFGTNGELNVNVGDGLNVVDGSLILDTDILKSNSDIRVYSINNSISTWSNNVTFGLQMSSYASPNTLINIQTIMFNVYRTPTEWNHAKIKIDYLIAYQNKAEAGSGTAEQTISFIPSSANSKFIRQGSWIYSRNSRSNSELFSINPNMTKLAKDKEAATDNKGAKRLFIDIQAKNTKYTDKKFLVTANINITLTRGDIHLIDKNTNVNNYP